MKKILIATISVLLAIPAVVSAQNSAGSSKATLAVTKVVATNALQKNLKEKGGTNSLDRILESMNANLSSALLSTRKFDVLSRSDIDALVMEQQFGASGNVNAKTAVKAGNFKGAQYIVTVLVDDYQDYVRKRSFSTLNKKTETRVIRYGAVANLIDAETGSIKETANFVISNEDRKDEDTGASTSGGDLTDSVISSLARNMCNDIALRISDVIFPAKIIAKSGKTVTFNRGEGTGVKVGDIFEVFALGEAMIDPDTGENLGSEETLIGTIKVTSVLPKFSKGVIVGDDNGIAKMQVLRCKKEPEAKAPASEEEL